jgi:antitoxin component YwqK of YwqJK toxin-antitoxin module
MVHPAQFRGKFLILMILFSSCFNREQKTDLTMFNSETVKLHLDNGIVMQNDKPFTGYVYTLAANKKDTVEITGFNNGREHGLWKKFYPNGRIMETRYFNNGKKAGTYYAWWPNGVMKLAYHFANGEYNGVCREWTEQKMLVKEMHYKDGYEEGGQKAFYNDGKIKANYVIIKGRRYGLLGTKNCVNVTDSVFKN